MTAYAAALVAFLAWCLAITLICVFNYGASKGRDWADEQARRVRR